MTSTEDYDEALAELEEQRAAGQVGDREYRQRRQWLERQRDGRRGPSARRADQYGQALDDLAAQRDAGTLTDGQYETRRVELLAELSQLQRPPAVKLLIGFATVVVILIIAFVIIRIFAAIITSVS